jgi:hypothetical protein
MCDENKAVGTAQLAERPDDPDNWSHRSEKMRCGTCMFFKEKGSGKVQRYDHRIGRCRRNAPTMKGFPVVYADDWCGEHKIDENK